MQSYLSAVATQSALLAVFSSLATDPAALNTLEALQQSLEEDILNGQTPNTAFLTALPSPVATVIDSIYAAEMSILSKDGFGDVVASAAPTAASTAAPTAAPTAAASASDSGASKTATATQKTSTTGTGAATAGTASASPVKSEKGAAGALGVDILKICGGLAVGVVGVVMTL